ncbi:MAG: hypothetical protein ACYDGN_10705 [Acidimicrobiales bacterium]
MIPSRAGRGLVLTTLIAGLVLTTAAPASLAAGAVQTGPTVTIHAAGPETPVTGYVVTYYGMKKYDTAAIWGYVKHAPVGSTIELFGQGFHKRAATRLSSSRVSGANQRYTFEVMPALATVYSIRVIRGKTQVAKSAALTIYVSSGGAFSPTRARSCNTAGNRPICHQQFEISWYLPASVAHFEVRKHQYAYLGVSLSPTNPASAPRAETLRTNWKISSLRWIDRTEVRFTVAFSFRVNNDAYYFAWSTCTQDTESRDGFGLPGHHQCGDKRISANWRYLG